MLDLVGENKVNKTYDELLNKIKILEERLKLQEMLLLNISHDLRNPINIILSIIQCMDYNDNNNIDERTSKEKEYLNLIKRNSYKMIKLIDNLIDTTKLEGNYYKLNISNVDIVSLVEATVTSIDEYAEQKKLQLVFDTNVEECIVGVDGQAIDRIVMNLLSNAIKVSPKESQILIDIFADDKNIKISVTDKGPGIPIKEQKLIFNRFAQSSNNKKQGYSGSGIGLDLVNYLTKAHNGFVTLVSNEGKGAKFIITLPKTKLDTENKDCEFIKKDKVQQLEIEFSDIYL